MKISKIQIENFRSHINTEIPISNFGCLTGENNAGKSSVLHAIQIAFDDRKILETDFRNIDEPVSIKVTIEDIEENDLQRVSSTHREQVRSMINNKSLTIVKNQSFSEKHSQIKYLTSLPKNSNLVFENIQDKLKGKTGEDLRKVAMELAPELSGKIGDKPTQKSIKEALEEIISNLNENDFSLQEAPLKTGISQGIKPLFPSIIYIEAVKDASIETKTAGSAAFGKLLSILFNEVIDEFEDLQNKFTDALKGLTVLTDSEGNKIDERLSAVREIEKEIENNICDSFPGVILNLQIPAPNLNMIFNSAELEIDDGYPSSVSTKGDGLKRTVLFALLKAYTQIRDNGLSANKEGSTNTEDQYKTPYLLLFEEPELYLHPKAQRQLMDSLSKFSKNHQVLVTTHSPNFFRPDTLGFARLHKDAETGVTVKSIDLSSMASKDSYQIIQHENNEAAFFANKVVLVEGDSDTFTYPHLAKLINPEWDNLDKNIMFVKIGGKGNVKKYKKFFEEFGIPVHVIVDSDALVNNFNLLHEDKSVNLIHSQLIEEVNKELPDINEPKSYKIKNIVKRNTAKDKWVLAQQGFKSWKTSKSENDFNTVISNLQELFSQGADSNKVEILEAEQSYSIATKKFELLTMLSNQRVHILRYGDLEVYCNTHVGEDKVETAIKFCEENNDIEKYKEILNDNADKLIDDLRRIFTKIYDS